MNKLPLMFGAEQRGPILSPRFAACCTVVLANKQTYNIL